MGQLIDFWNGLVCLWDSHLLYKNEAQNEVISHHLRFKQAQPKMYHSPKVVEWVNTQLFTSCIHIFRPFREDIFLNCHISSTVRAFDLISKLRARPQYQLSFDIRSHKVDTKCPNKLPLILVGLRYF